MKIRKDKFTILFYRFAEPSYPGQCQHTAVVWELNKDIILEFLLIQNVVMNPTMLIKIMSTWKHSGTELTRNMEGKMSTFNMFSHIISIFTRVTTLVTNPNFLPHWILSWRHYTRDLPIQLSEIIQTFQNMLNIFIFQNKKTNLESVNIHMLS